MCRLLATIFISSVSAGVLGAAPGLVLNVEASPLEASSRRAIFRREAIAQQPIGSDDPNWQAIGGRAIGSAPGTSDRLHGEGGVVVKPAQQSQSMGLVEYRQAVKGSTPIGIIKLGTPRKELNMIIDTGSDKFVARTWASVVAELERIDPSIPMAIQPKASVYASINSSSYVQLFMNSTKHLGKQEAKMGFISYGSGAAITKEGQDTVGMGGQELVDFPISEIMKDQLRMLHGTGGIVGILGLQHMQIVKSLTGRAARYWQESVFSRSRDKGLMYSFGLCRNTDDDSTFIWNDQAKDGHEQPVLGHIHWAVGLGKVKFSMNASSSRSAPHGAQHRTDDADLVLTQQDSGTEDLATLRAENDQLRQEIRKAQHGKRHSPDDHAQIQDGDESGGNDPDFKGVIGKAIGDIIGKVVERIKNKLDAPKAGESKELCQEAGSCAAIIDTGSNIIAAPRAFLEEFSRLVKVKTDCSNLDSLPTLALTLGDFSVTLPPSAYVMQVTLPRRVRTNRRGDGGDGSGEGDGVGGVGGGDIDGAPSDSSFDMPSQLVRRNSQAPRSWQTALNDLRQDHGIDLFATMPADVDLESLDTEDKLCMPALVPLDKDTRLGKLWVIGTPLFDQYYTRWSFPKDAQSPSIFFEKKEQAGACKASVLAANIGAKESGAHSQSGGNGGSKGDGDAKGNSKKLSEDSSGEAVGDLLEVAASSADMSIRVAPHRRVSFSSGRNAVREVSLHDIRYPHWAKDLSIV